MQRSSFNGRVLAALLLTMCAAQPAQSACVGLGCDGPVRDAGIICCNQLFYDAGKEGVGADRTVNCQDYLENRARPEARQSICNQLQSKGLACPAAAGICDSANPNGKYCGANMPERGAVFAMGSMSVGRIHSTAAASSAIVGTQPNGTRLVYHRITRINGEPWYYVSPPGRPAGWIQGSAVACTRPGTPIPYNLPGYVPHDPKLPTERPTAAIVAGARG